MKRIKELLNKLYESNVWLLLIVILVSDTLVTVLEQRFIFTDDLYFATYGEATAYESVVRFLEFKESVQWAAYTFGAMNILVRVALTALVLNIGILFAGLKTNFSRVFQVVVVAELAYVVYNFFLFFYLRFIIDVQTLQEIGTFTNFSLLAFFPDGAIEPMLKYPLQLVNIFEILYWVVLTYGMSYITEKSMGKSFKMVLGSYGVGLLVWVVTVVFFMVTYL